MELHLTACDACRKRLERYEAFSRGFGSLPSPAEDLPGSDAGLTDARERVWDYLSRMTPDNREKKHPASPIFRPISLPLPAAVAAMVAVALVAALVGGILSNPRPPAAIIAGPGGGVDMQSIIPVTNMAGVLQYLEKQDTSADIVIIRLPETQNFMSIGEPALVRAADYSRRDASR